MSARLILIRHGETDWNIEKRYCGFKDVPLNANGVKQAERLHDRFRNEKTDKIYSSDSSRAFDFAKIIFKGRTVEKMPELREINFGIFEGLTYEETMKKYPEIYSLWLKDPFRVTIPKGDNLTDFKKRADAVINRLLSLNGDGKTLAVITHYGFISVIMSSFSDSKDFWDIKPELGGVTIIEFENGKGKEGGLQ